MGLAKDPHQRNARGGAIPRGRFLVQYQNLTLEELAGRCCLLLFQMFQQRHAKRKYWQLSLLQ